MKGSKVGRFRPAALGLFVVVCESVPCAVSAQTFRQFPIPNASGPQGITVGSDGNLWFTAGSSWVGSISTSGSITAFPVNYDGTFGITLGPDGNIWFTVAAGDESKICRITPEGVITQFGRYGQFNDPAGITMGSDGNLWITEKGGNRIDRMTVTGGVTAFGSATQLSGPLGIAAGPDGNIWFTETSGNRIGRITPEGEITQFPILAAGSAPTGIASGPDGNLWFTESSGNKIGRIRPGGEITEFSLPAGGGPAGIVAGPGGVLWFTEKSGNRIGRITTSGEITEYAIPTSDSGPSGVVVGPDGGIWFTEATGHRVGLLMTGESVACAADATTLCLNEGRFQVRTQFETRDGSSGAGRAVALTGDTGYFTFFDSANIEVVAKVLNGCGINGRYWVFTGGLTNVHVVLTVVDTKTGASLSYESPLGTAFAPIQDTGAFPACP